MQELFQSSDLYSRMRYKYEDGENGRTENKFVKMAFPIIKHKKIITQLSFH